MDADRLILEAATGARDLTEMELRDVLRKRSASAGRAALPRGRNQP